MQESIAKLPNQELTKRECFSFFFPSFFFRQASSILHGSLYDEQYLGG